MLNVWIVLRFLQPCDFLEVYHETDGTPEMAGSNCRSDPFQRQRALNALAASDPDRASHAVIEERIADERAWHCAPSPKHQGGGQSEGADFPNPERQYLREPAEGMDAKVQPSGDRVPGQSYLGWRRFIERHKGSGDQSQNMVD